MTLLENVQAGHQEVQIFGAQMVNGWSTLFFGEWLQAPLYDCDPIT